jgi:hypothetical protein
MVRVTKWRVLFRMIGFISILVTISLSHIYYRQYSAMADLITFQFNVAHALVFSVSTSRLLAMDLNTESITSNHHEVFLSSITVYSSVLICTQLIFTIHYWHAPFSSCTLNCLVASTSLLQLTTDCH